MSKKQITIPVFIPHLGCPHKCVFCNQWQSTGVRDIPDSKLIGEKVELFLSKKPDSVERTEIAFFGGSFTGIDPEKQRELLKTALQFKKLGKVNAIRLSTRPDYIDDEKLTLLKEFEVDTVELGIQSFNEDALIAAGRGHSVNDTLRAIEKLKEYRFEFVIQLMPGLPKDSPDSAIRSAEKAASLRPSAIRIYPAVILRNTRLAEMFRAGEYIPLSMERAIEICKEMLATFQQRSIPVIRIGIHPLAENEMEGIIAGPYHPAFGYMVKSRLKRDMLEAGIKKHIEKHGKTGNRIIVDIPETEREEFIGYRRENLVYLDEKFKDIEIEFRNGIGKAVVLT